VSELAAGYPDVEAVVTQTERISYSELARRVEDLARGLLALGVSRGDKVACWLPNQIEWVVTKLAATSIGGVLVAVNTWYTSREIKYVVTHAEASVLVTSRGIKGHNFYETLASVVPELGTTVTGEPVASRSVPALRWVVGVDRDPPRGVLSVGEVVRRGVGMAEDALERAMAAVVPDEPADLLYTSGSTADPKGVILLHGGLIVNGFHIGARQHITSGDRLWLANPLFFSYGCANALMVTLSHRATLVLQRLFDPGEALRMLDAERCTALYGTTNMVLAMLAHPDYGERDLSSLRTGTAIGGPDHIRARMQLGASKICNSYGLTETYGHCCDSDADEPEEVRLHASGRPLPGNELRIVDSTSGEILPPGRPGEIRVRGYVTPGYYRAPELSARSFDEDGFFRTGDQGYLDVDGQVHWQARLSEIIKTGGINVAPLEVETVLGQHPEVETASVVGLPDESRDEIVAAVVAPRAGSEMTAARLTEFCRERMASYKVPRRIMFLPASEFPLTPTGKVWNKELRRRLLEDSKVVTNESRESA
jgi:fatty-acyl-CoA synthase